MEGRRINAVSFNMFRLAHTGFSPGTMAKWKVEGDNVCWWSWCSWWSRWSCRWSLCSWLRNCSEKLKKAEATPSHIPIVEWWVGCGRFIQIRKWQNMAPGLNGRPSVPSNWFRLKIESRSNSESQNFAQTCFQTQIFQIIPFPPLFNKFIFRIHQLLYFTFFIADL